MSAREGTLESATESRQKPRAAIVMVAVNAGYAHTSMSLRCLLANLGDLRADTVLEEFDSQLDVLQMAEVILAYEPRIVAFSVYIWNVDVMVRLIRVIRHVRPACRIVVGGPQIIAEEDPAAILPLVDVAIEGEGEGVIKGVFERLLQSEDMPHVVCAQAPDLATVALPYADYSDEDLAHRMVYVEATRGCPFRCAYCTSSRTHGIRSFPKGALLEAFEKLLDRGVHQFKFLDRSFNFGGETALSVLDFFATRQFPGLRLHFEFTPDALNSAWQTQLKRFGPGMLHIEMGIQTWNETVARGIDRPMKATRVESALRFMIEDVQADVHADLIVGLPGETEASFREGFDRLVRLAPTEIQVGVLKCLPGTSIHRFDADECVRWNPLPPYEILENRHYTFARLREMGRFAKCWDLLFNRGRFCTSAPLLWADGGSPFVRVMDVAEVIYATYQRLHALGPKRIAEALRTVLVNRLGLSEAHVMAALESDARRFAQQHEVRDR